jgi:hypothetical protein
MREIVIDEMRGRAHEIVNEARPIVDEYLLSMGTTDRFDDVADADCYARQVAEHLAVDSRVTATDLAAWIIDECVN